MDSQQREDSEHGCTLYQCENNSQQLRDGPSGQVHMARLHNVEMQPYLHYRFLLLETRRVTDFESLDSFDAWFDRQAKVAHR